MIMNSSSKYVLHREGLLILFLTTFFGCFLFLQSGHFAVPATVDPLLQVCITAIAGLLALPLFLPGTQRTGWRPVSFLKAMAFPKTPQRWVPLLLFLNISCHTIGHFVILYYTIMHLVVPTSSWCDLACLSGSLPLLLAILLLPSQPLSTEKRFHIVLDGLMIMVGAITFSWYFILGPSIMQGATTMIARIVSIAYPLEVLFLVFCLLLLVLRTNDHTIRPVVILLSLGLAVLAVTYSIFGYERLHDTYRPGELLEAGWLLGYLLLGLAARTMLVIMRSTGLHSNAPSVLVFPHLEAERSFAPPLLWRSMLPYLLIPPVVLLLLGTFYVADNDAMQPGVFLGAITLVGLLTIRQFFTVQAMAAQNNKLCLMQQDLHATNDALKLANGQLEHQTWQLEQANEQLSHLNQLRDQFVANINHELRTPLTLIDGYLELLSDYQGRMDETMQATFIKHAREGSQELLLLVNNILDTFRISTEVEPARLEPVALCQLVHEVCEQFPPQGEQGSRLQVELPDSLIVKADLRYLRQTLRNLLSNALKYSPPETCVSIGAQIIDHADTSRICIYVQDAGPGIPPEEQALLFQKFVRLQRDLSGPIRGTGLGLYMCKQLVEAMNGEIWIESSGNQGEGSRFCFTLNADQPLNNQHPTTNFSESHMVVPPA